MAVLHFYVEYFIIITGEEGTACVSAPTIEYLTVHLVVCRIHHRGVTDSSGAHLRGSRRENVGFPILGRHWGAGVQMRSSKFGL